MWWIIVLLGLWFFEVWPFGYGHLLGPRVEYVAEVSYRVGDRIDWRTGIRRPSLTECRHDIADIVSSIRRAEHRVVGSSCRIMHGERFMDRT